MTDREQRRAPKRRPPEERTATSESAKKCDDLKEDMDRLLDEIDSVLEENAEEFIKNYVQKGGQ